MASLNNRALTFLKYWGKLLLKNHLIFVGSDKITD